MEITKRDLAILSLHTGNMFGLFSDMHKLAEEVAGFSLFTHDFTNKEFIETLKERSKDEFVLVIQRMEESAGVVRHQ